MTYRTVYDRLRFGSKKERRKVIRSFSAHKGKVPFPLCSISTMVIGTLKPLKWVYCVHLAKWMPPGKFHRECKQCQIKIEEILRAETQKDVEESKEETSEADAT